MAEHDYVIANQNGANTRSDLNNALAAIVSNNSKASAPTTTYAYMWWADTANDILKQRNGADSAWISILTLSTGAPLATIANFTSTGIDDNATSTAITIDASENVTLAGTVNGLEINTTVTSNLGLGTGAVDSITTGDYNVGVGDGALTANTTGDFNTAVGDGSLYANTTGNNNTAVGYWSLRANTGVDNTATGYESLRNNTTGSYNNAFGKNTLHANTTGSRNVAIGNNTMRDNTTGNYNIAMGYDAFANNTTGTFNTSLGYRSLPNHTTGSDNVAVGYETGEDVTTGTKNTLLGALAGQNITSGDSCVMVGYQAGAGGNRANALYIARDNSAPGNNACWVYGDGSGNVTQGNNQTTWSQASDERIKKNITDSSKGLAEINQLQIRNFEYRTPEEITAEGITGCDNEGIQVGIIAQELEVPFPEAVFEGQGGKKQARTDAVFWAMVNAIKELSAKVEALENA